MAGFQLSTNGRIWVFTEGMGLRVSSSPGCRGAGQHPHAAVIGPGSGRACTFQRTGSREVPVGRDAGAGRVDPLHGPIEPGGGGTGSNNGSTTSRGEQGVGLGALVSRRCSGSGSPIGRPAGGSTLRQRSAPVFPGAPAAIDELQDPKLVY